MCFFDNCKSNILTLISTFSLFFLKVGAFEKIYDVTIYSSFKNLTLHPQISGMIVDVFIPCEIDQFYPQIGVNMMKLLKHVGCTVNYPSEQICCGKCAFEWGNWQEAKKSGEKFLTIFSGNHPIVCPSTTCPSYIKNHYKKIFQNTAQHIVYQRILPKIYEFSDFFYNILNVTDVGASFPHKVVWIDSASAQYVYKLKQEPQKLLSKVKGIEVITLDDVCNFEGNFLITNKNIAMAMAHHLIEKVLKTNASYIASTDMSCLMFLEHYLKQEKLNIQVIHIIDILASKE